MDDQLYDKVHAVVVNWLIEFIKGKTEWNERWPGLEVYPEYPYNFYGQRGSVDICSFHNRKDHKEVYSVTGNKPENTFEIYEVWTAVQRLEEALRKFNEKASVVPKAFRASRKPTPVIDLQQNYFVLLNTMQNVTLVRDHLELFRTQFDNIGKASGNDWSNCNNLVFVDPLNFELVEWIRVKPDGSEELVDGMLPWRNPFIPNVKQFFLYDFDTEESKPIDILRDWIYIDAKDFWIQWQKEKGNTKAAP